MATSRRAGSCTPSQGPRSLPSRANPVCPNLSLEPGPCCCQGVQRDIFVDMDSLGVLAEVVEPRELSAAVASKRSLPRVLPVSSVSWSVCEISAPI